jgi:hypothetical protein
MEIPNAQGSLYLVAITRFIYFRGCCFSLFIEFKREAPNT